MRIFRVYKESGRPFPQVSDDEVVDFMVMEALTYKAVEEDAEAQKKAERDQWKAEIKNKGKKG